MGAVSLPFGTHRSSIVGNIGVGDINGRLHMVASDFVGQLRVSAVDNCFANDW